MGGCFQNPCSNYKHFCIPKFSFVPFIVITCNFQLCFTKCLVVMLANFVCSTNYLILFHLFIFCSHCCSSGCSEKGITTRE